MYRVGITLARDDDSNTDVMVGDLVVDYEEYLTTCSDLWHRLKRVEESRDKEVKEA